MTITDIANHFDHRASKYESHYTSVLPSNIYSYEKQERSRIAIDWIENYFSDQNRQPKRALDIGCGNGHVLRRIVKKFPDCLGAGFDVSRDMTLNAQRLAQEQIKLGQLTFHTGQVSNAEGQFDLVISLGVIGYQYNQRQFAQDLAHQVAPGGMLIISFGNRNSLCRGFLRGIQYLRERVRSKVPRVHYGSISSRRLIRDLGLCRLKLYQCRYIGYGIGLPVGRGEVHVSQLAESVLHQATLARFLAITGIMAWKRKELNSCEGNAQEAIA